MPDMNSTFFGAELRTWITGGAIVLLVALAHVGLGVLVQRACRKRQRAHDAVTHL